MSNALKYIKGSRTRVLNTLPSKDFGNEGDFVISHIKGKGVFLCTKVGNSWFTANKLQQLNKIGIANLNEITTNKLTFNRVVNSSIDTDKFIVSDGGQLKYRTGEQVADELGVAINDVQYKQAYCSLGQYTNKEDCESNNGTWYYSDNDSHDSISSTAENELLTVASTLGKLDAEPTLLYDGSTLEIKRNSDFDDNWQTSAQTDLLKLTYDSDNFGSIGMSSIGNMGFTVGEGGVFHFYEKQADGIISSRIQLNTDDGILRLNNPSNILDYFSIDIDDNAVTTIKTVDFSGAVGHLTLDVDGDLVLDSVLGNGIGLVLKTEGTTYGLINYHHSATYINLYENGGASTDDYLFMSVAANAETAIATHDAAGTAGHISLVPDGDLILDPVSQKVIINATDKLYFDGGTDTYIDESSADVLDITVGALKMMTLDEGNTAVKILGAQLEIPATKGLHFDGGGDTYMYEVSADTLRTVVGGDVIMHISENGDDGNNVYFSSSCVTFQQIEPTYNASVTVVDFRHSNKQFVTFGSGNITSLALYFPNNSGNFVLLLKQDGTGSRTITNYKVYEYDESLADGSSTVVFAGGSNPTLTTDANHVDILSFYWDGDNEIAYGVATLDFQF